MRTFMRRLAFRADHVARGRGVGLILVYHRVADEPSDPYGLCVTPAHFEEHVQVLQRLGAPMSVGGMGRAVRDGSLPYRAMGITFDDAYVDVLEAAVPILRHHEVPATVFVTLGPGGRDREFWWDELERVLLEPGMLPETLELELDGSRRSWSLGGDANYDPDAANPACEWRLFDGHEPTARHAVFRELYFLLRPLSPDARAHAMDELVGWAGQKGTPVRRSRQVLSADDVADMTADGLIEAGAHTVTHVDMPSQSAHTQNAEARRSKEELERWAGRAVEGFAYPYGRYDAGSVAAVRAAGFAFACSGDHRVVRPGDDPLTLPRVDVPPGDGDVLAALIRQFLG